MKEKKHTIQYKEYSNLDELKQEDRDLLKLSIEAADKAYAPYSLFNVGASLKLKNGQLLKGSNQENAAFPSGLCAERVVVFSTSANFPNETIETIAVYAKDSIRSENVISPCGACRQVMSEYEQKQNAPIRILLMSSDKVVWEFPSIESLLPFSFKLEALKS